MASSKPLVEGQPRESASARHASDSSRDESAPREQGLRVLMIAGYGPSLITFRGALIKAMVQAGARVLCVAPEEDPALERMLREMGASYTRVPLERSRIGIWSDLKYSARIQRICEVERPDLVVAYTVKPIVFGLTAARRAGVKRRFALITGLGYAFTGQTALRRLLGALVSVLYRRALVGAERVFFQNPDDRDLFVSRRITLSGSTEVVAGSGVDVDEFAPVPIKAKPLTFLLIARLLAEKGIREYVHAARIIKKEFHDIRFLLVGPRDPSLDAISESEVRDWNADGVIQYLGALADVRPAIAQASVYVLPSYREGTPRTVLEAMAMGRPVITTDVPGCRETVISGLNGYLVQPRDAQSLVNAMSRFISDSSLVESMGSESRKIASARFDVRIVNKQILDAMGITREHTDRV